MGWVSMDEHFSEFGGFSVWQSPDGIAGHFGQLRAVICAMRRAAMTMLIAARSG